MKKLFIILLILCLTPPTSGQFQQKPMLGQQVNRGHQLGDFVGAWLFLEGSGGKVYDLSGNGNIGTFTTGQSPIWTIGPNGHCLAFTADSIDLSNTGSLKKASQSGLTVIYKIDMGSINSYDCVVSAGKWDAAWAMMHNAATTFPRVYAFNRTITCPVDFGTGEYTFAFTADAVRFDWYKNGIWVGESIGAGTWEMDSQIAAIGASYNAGNPLYELSDAKLYWVYIYNRVLSASEISQLYRKPFCMFEQDDIAIMATAAAPPPSGGQVIIIQMSAIPLIFILSLIFIKRRSLGR